MVVDYRVPLHAATGWKHGGESLNGAQLLNTVLGGTLYTGDSTQAGTHRTIAGRLTTPGRAKDIGQSVVHDSNDRIIIVHQLAVLGMFQPERGMGALAGTTLGNKRIAIAMMHDGRGMNQHGVPIGPSKGIGQHQGIIKSEGAHQPVAIQRTTTIGEIAIGNQQTAVAIVDITDDKLIASVRQLIDQGVAIASIKLPDEFLVARRTDGVIDSQREKKIIRLLTALKRSKGREQRH